MVELVTEKDCWIDESEAGVDEMETILKNKKHPDSLNNLHPILAACLSYNKEERPRAIDVLESLQFWPDNK